jgi:hypothetical protein
MTQLTSPHEASVKELSEKVLSRRRLLKLLVASSGAVAAVAVSLPEKWDTPVVEVGALPAHAATSDNIN